MNSEQREVNSAIIKALARLATMRVSDAHWEAEVLPRDRVMDEVMVIRAAVDSSNAALTAQPASAAGVEGSSGSVKQKLPPPKKYPKPDAEGNDTGPCCAHAYADGWNECRAAMLAAAPKPEDAA